MIKQGSAYKSAVDGLYRFMSGYVSLTKSEYNRILPFIEIREFDKKARILEEGELENYMNIVARGLVRKYLPVRNKEIVIQLATEGHIVHSEISFHYRTPSKAVVETIEPSMLLSISYDNLQQLYEQFPKTERLGRLIASDLFVRADVHYVDQLKKNVRERFLDYVQNHPHMLQRVPQKYLASYLNIKPETFSRLKHLVRKK